MNIFRKKIEDKSISEQLEVVISELGQMTEDYAELETKFNTSVEENKNLVEELTVLKAKTIGVEEQLEEVEEEKEVLEQEQAELVKEKVELDELASTKAIDILSEVGQYPIELIEDPAEEEMETKRPLLESLKELKGSELTQFFKDNKAEIFKLIKQQ